jgi:hypothetical protein
VAIINLRGISGSGKSTIVVQVMDLYAERTPLMIEGRKRPIGYVLRHDSRATLYVPGHYETACGGCDTIKTPDQAYELVRAAVAEHRDVMYEGIMVQDDVRRAVELNKEHKLLVIALTTSVKDCLAGVQARRDARGDERERELNPKNTISRARSVENKIPRLKAGGVEVLRLSREEALAECLRRLGWS